MKNLKKIMAAVLAVMMISAMAVGAISSFAAGTSGVSITVTRDTDTYKGEADANSREFTWYKIFSAVLNQSNTATGGGYISGTGAPGDVTNTPASGTSVSYTVESKFASEFGEWVAKSGETPAHWDRKEATTGNKWFLLAPIAGDADHYSVTWDKTVTDTSSTNAQAAAQWLIDNKIYEKSGSLTWTGSNWSAEGLDKGYYVLESVAGKNLIAATADINVKEKNEYPPIDKTQSDEDDTTKNDETRDVAVGDVLNYEVKVTIPKTANIGDEIVVWDKQSEGLKYNNDVAVKTGTNSANAQVTLPYSGKGSDTTAAWNALIKVTNTSQLGSEIVFTFSMTVTSDAIVDTEKENESGLKYGNGSGSNPFPYESVPDKVEYKTYFGGIIKIDGDTNEKLPGVKFELKEAASGSTAVAFPVTKSGSYYYPVSSGSNEVITDASGSIKIRGLDGNKTYTLTETETLPGYNKLTEDVILTLSLDSVKKITYTPVAANATFDNKTTYYKQISSGSYSVAHITAFASGTTYYTKGEVTYDFDDAPEKAWVEVRNNKGSLLPSTGGIGTTIFYVVGAVLVIGSGIVLVTKKRMGKEEN